MKAAIRLLEWLRNTCEVKGQSWAKPKLTGHASPEGCLVLDKQFADASNRLLLLAIAPAFIVHYHGCNV